MQWPDAGVKIFPSPHRAEPERLRLDIIDELADHLALAAEDEVVKHGQSQEGAWKCAIERFGNPNAVARKLWWDAMKERVMRDWIHSGIAAASAIVVVLVAVLVINSIKQMQSTQVELIAALKQMNQPAAPAGETLDIEVHRGSETGPPAAGIEVTLSGKLNQDSSAQVSLTTDAQGHVRFSPVPQGAYILNLDDPHSMLKLQMQHSLFAGVGSSLQVVAPETAAVEKQVVLDKPLPFPNESVLAVANLEVKTTVKGIEWSYDEYIGVGNQGIYTSEGELFSPIAHHTYRVNGPVQSILLPDVPPELDHVGLGFMSPDGELVVIDTRRIGMTTNADGRGYSDKFEIEGSRITIGLTDAQMELAQKLVKDKLYTERLGGGYWSAKRLVEGIPLQPYLDDYLVQAIPVTDIQGAALLETGEGKATLTAKGTRSVGSHVYAGSQEFPAVMRMPELAALNERYPGNYRFLLRFEGVNSGEFFFWRGDKWFTDSETPIDVALEQMQVAEKQIAEKNVLDVTEFFRSGASTGTAGVLIKLKSEGEAVHVGLEDQKREDVKDKASLPWLLVVSDTPPADL